MCRAGYHELISCSCTFETRRILAALSGRIRQPYMEVRARDIQTLLVFLCHDDHHAKRVVVG
jgi:hypothetical protein